MSKMLIIGWFGLMAGLGAASYDEFYYSQGSDGKWHRKERVSSESQNSYICIRGCVQVDCNVCHLKAVDGTKYPADLALKHTTTHFPASSVRLADGQTLRVGTFTLLKRSSGLLVTDGQGRKMTLPADAMVLKDKTGAPALVRFSGATVPELTR